jgi:hypothetical protein
MRYASAMGKLAERFTDAARSGVYRVRAGDVPRAAAAEASAHLLEVRGTALVNGGWPMVQRALDAAASGICVVLVEEAAPLAHSRHAQTLTALRAAAQASGERGRPCFVVLVDPQAQLALPLLYHEAPAALE